MSGTAIAYITCTDPMTTIHVNNDHGAGNPKSPALGRDHQKQETGRFGFADLDSDIGTMPVG
jgi:hypothetical protein